MVLTKKIVTKYMFLTFLIMILVLYNQNNGLYYFYTKNFDTARFLSGISLSKEKPAEP